MAPCRSRCRRDLRLPGPLASALGSPPRGLHPDALPLVQSTEGGVGYLFNYLLDKYLLSVLSAGVTKMSENRHCPYLLLAHSLEWQTSYGNTWLNAKLQ